MIDHLAGHAAIDADVLARDESGLVGAEIEHHIGNVQRIPHTTDWLLCGIGTFIDGVGDVNPTRRDGVYTYLSGKTDSQGMSQRRNAAFCCRIAFRLRLAHTVA